MDDDPNRVETSESARLIELGELTMSSERAGDVHKMRLFGALDASTAAGVQDELERVQRSDAGALVVDLSGLTFVDSTGVRTVLTAHARARAKATPLTLVRGPEPVQRLFELAGVDDMLPFTDRA